MLMTPIEKGYVCPDLPDCTECQFFKNECIVYGQKNIEMLLSEISKNADTFQKFGDDTEIFFEYEKKKVTKVSIKKEAKK